MKICPVCSTEYADDVKFCPNDGQTLRAAAPASNLVGQVVADRYHVLKKLGEGGMGQVYLAEHVKMGRRSAIKVMNPSMVHDPDAVARFNREAANASRITHPNVCAIYDFGETADGIIYLAMEFIEGEPLTDLLEREGVLPVPRAVHIFSQVADALQAAHDLGIVHRDLKPDNIMLARRKDGADVVKVVDFGIAKAVGGEGGDESGQKVTKTGLVVGTPEFMSPEQLSGDKLDGRSDLYSLALVFYRMLAGKLPFEATTVQETMIKRLTDEPTPLAQARPDLRFPAGLQAVLDTALSRTPVDRYQTVAKFAADAGAAAGVDRGRTAVVPQTRGGSGVDAKTQLLEVAKPAAPKRRSRVPVIAGIVAVVGLGGAAAVILQGGGAKTGGPDSIPAVLQNTAGNPANMQTGDSQKAHTVTTLANRDTGTRRPPPPRTGIDPARAGDILDGLIESPSVIKRDSATKVFNTAGVAVGERAFAACMIAQAEQDLGNRTSALQWARTGLGLNAALTSCQNVVHALGS
ncbi:MAG TPA: serine/threonine-protein kinase [Gemmatimonadales bacterium]|nr:serine/threonine-protein kinase [Gemmatimonadales bacterium]